MKDDDDTIVYPSYDVESQLRFLGSLCESVNFDCRKLIPLIFADWILTFQKGCQVSPPSKVFFEYVRSTANTYKQYKDFEKLIKESENAEKKN